MPLCPYCESAWPSTSSLNRHQSRHASCRTKKLQHLNTLYHPHYSSNAAELPEPPVEFQVTGSSQTGGISSPLLQNENTPSPQYELDPHEEQQTRCGITIEDVTEESIWTENFPPEKGAGRAYYKACTSFENIRDEQNSRSDDVYGAFTSEEEWDLAKWLVQNVGHNAIETFLKLPIIKTRVDPEYSTKDKLLDKVDALPGGVKWTCKPIIVEGDRVNEDGEKLTEELELWMRDPVECVRELIGNPVFHDVIRYAPEKQYVDPQKLNERIGEMWTAEWWWELQKVLPAGAMIAPVILLSDKTKLSQFRGDKSAWPVYLTIGNIAKDVRRCANSHATILIGYLPVGKYECFLDKTRSVAQYRTFHRCMSYLTASLVNAGQNGVEITCADGLTRWVFPILAAYVADYPEQCLVACCMENHCPICKVDPKQRGDHQPTSLELRNPRESIRLLKEYEAKIYNQDFINDGLRPIHEPFWANLPYTNVFQAFTPDLLHQLHKGVFKDHAVKWCTQVIGEAELDDCFKSLPSYPNLRHFKNGISFVSQWTGAEFKAMEKVFVSLLAGGVEDRVLVCVRAAIDFIFYSSLTSHTTETLTSLQNALTTFHQYKDIFLELNARQSTHFNIPKIHSMQHYVALVRHFGSADGFNTESPERLHINYAKNAYRASNKKDYTIQMTRWLQRQEAVDRFSLFLDWMKRGMFKSDGRREPVTAGVIPPAVVTNDTNPHSPSTPKPNTVTTRRRSSLKLYVLFFSPMVLKYFLEPTTPSISITLPKISMASQSPDALKNVIRAMPPTPAHSRVKASMGYLNFALISTSEWNGKTEGTTLEGLQAARVRVLFQLPAVYRLKMLRPLAYIEWLTPVGTPDPITGLMILKPSTRNHHVHGEIM
ncbi:hypothetical protein E1B28_002977 [Marasmius oreades]|uniref:C2H2-type domain-containing protein n=1 Tax=Marasmius oreades TaxID=181124 RepID=A0A9P7RLG8_9AGAR|nr:uncharacterized protein E1B28_002977 [Marasmius oreades]KAG7085416.1 hypothetical protein E1B28_002977 [Marasmius oreades]